MRLEMLEMAGEVGVKWTGRLQNVCMQDGRIPKEWRMDLIVPIWKRKGDVHDPGKYRGSTILSQVPKLLERVLDARIRRRIECDFGEEQQGFRKVVKDVMKKLLYADDLSLVPNCKQELQETVDEWNGLFTEHGLNLNLEKTAVLHIGHQKEELDIELEGKKLTQRDSFVYLGEAVCGDGKTSKSTGRSERVDSI